MTFRIATFNLENLGDAGGNEEELAFRIGALRPQLLRIEADVLCLQEVNAQEEPGHQRSLRALEALLRDTDFPGWEAHRQAHNRLLRVFLTFNADYRLGRLDGEQGVDFIVDWLMTHLKE